MTTIIEQMKRIIKLKQINKLIILTAMLLLGGMTAKGQQAYVIVNSNYYLTHGTDGHSVQTTASTGFDPRTCIWSINNSTIKTANESGTAFAGNYFLQTGSVSLGNSANWYTAPSDGANLRATRWNYLRRNNTTWTIDYTNTNRAIAYTVSINPNSLSDNTTLPAITINGYSGNTITFSHDGLGGSYVPANTYTTYTFNSTNTHNWYNNTDYGTNVPDGISVNANTLSPTYTWSLTSNGGGVATINSSTGVLTLSGAPTANITVRLTVSNISPLNNKTVDFTLTRANVYENTNTVTTLSTPTINPTSATLNYNGSQEFTASATATTTTTTIPDHTTLTGGGNTYYYYNGTLYTSTNGFSQQTTTTPSITYSWALTGAATSCLSPTSGSGSTITLNYNTSSATNLTGTLTVTATAGGQTKNQTASITALAANPDYITITTPSPVVIYVSGTGTVRYTLNTRDFYDNVTGTSSNESVFTVGNVSGGTAVINPVAVGTATLTLTAHKTNGDPITPSATATIKVKDKVATPEISFTQIGEGETATANISCATSGATIYYKVNSGSYSAYSPGLTVNENDVVYAYAAMTGNDLWDDSDETHATYIPCKTPDPVITFTASGTPTTATVTITAETGATIYYTSGTNPSNPTTGSSYGTSSVTINNVANGTVVKAFAKNSTCSSSNIVTENIMFSGVSSDGVVTLYDYEDHSWSYYSDPECPVRSLSPADVKITYYGNGIVMKNDNDYTASTSSTDYVVPGNSMYVGGAKVNVGGEDENTFVYYKTLERGDATQTAWTYSSSNQSSAASRCPYTTIYNPFQVRPTYGSRGTTDANDFTGWRGFQCWRLKSVSGGAVYSAASNGTALSNGAIIDADAEIYFAPNSEYGMEVALEAVWARAYLIKGNQGGANAILSYNVGVERNFMTLTANENYRFNGGTGRRITNVGYPATISCYYPNGEAPDNTGGAVTGNNNNITLAGASFKFENVRLSAGSYTLTANGYDLIVGRGCTSTSVGTVRGMSDGSSSAVSYTIRLESGTYNTYAAIDNTAHTYSNTISARSIFGSDYDRAKGDNAKLSIAPSSTCYGGNAVHVFNSSSNRNNLTYDWLIKSGKVQGSKSITDANADEAIYIGNSGNSDNTQYMGKRRFTMEGGEVASIAGGLNSYGNNYSTYAVNDGIAVEIRIKEGLVRGSIYGAAAYASAAGDRRFVFTGGTIKGWVAGGANGTQSDGGYLYGSSALYIGGETQIDSRVNGTSSTNVINRAVGGNVFGAGCGYGASSNSGQVTLGTTVVVADNAYIERGVYGGGSYGYTTNTSNLYILGGTVDGKAGGVSGTTYSANITGGVFGGACQNQGGTVNITMKDGLVEGGVYGGSNATGTVAGPVTMKIDGGQVGTGTGSGETANIHGGGYGSATRVSGNVEITLGASGQTEPGVTVYGDVYGGSALGYVNGTTATTTYHTNVTLNKGTINGSLYGGGLGNSSTAANVYGPVQVKVYGGSVNKTDANGANGSGAVYGCNNISGAPQRAVSVDIFGTDPAPSDDQYALFAVYGGGNQASYSYGTPTVTVHNCNNSIEYVYGGGNAAHITNGNTDVTIYGGNKIGNVFGGGNGTVTAANVSGNTNVKIYGGTIGRVFGGSNSQGTIGGTINVTVEKTADTDSQGSSTACAMHIDEVYGGGNMAASNAGSITIGCTGGEGEGIGDLYGGANQANITGNINLNITGGSIQRVFGGNNLEGSISGTIGVTVNWNSTNPCENNYVGEVFGGGNLAQYSSPNDSYGNPTYPRVSILNGTVSGNVYGGGKGDPNDHTKGQVTGNPIVTIGDNVTGHKAIVTGDVYGGGDAGNVVGTPQVNVVNKCDTEITNVYGGGNAADVSGTDVNIDGGIISGMVFGGGHGDKNANPPTAANVTYDVSVTVTGGTINKVFGGSNSNGTIGGAVAVDIDKGATSCDMHITEVYGGGNEADGNAGTITIKCTGDYENNGEGITTVFGGANEANVGNSINLTIQGGHIDNVYGGNNHSGNISGSTTVNVNWDNTLTCGKYLGNVFGGGNEAALNGAATVNIQNGTVSHNVYGGGNKAGVGSATVSMTGGSVLEGLYGGCNTSGTVGGAIAVTLTGGTIGTSSNRADVFGGGLGVATATSGNIGVTLNGTTVYGDIYGGSALGSVNSASANPANTTTLTIGSNTLHGTIYGGGKGSIEGSGTTAISNGNVLINYNTANTNLTGLYGGANINGNVIGNITLNVLANVGASGSSINVFGGGLGHATNTQGNVTVNVGAANGSSTPIVYGDIYGGSALGNVNDAVADLTTVNILNGTVHGNVYGGGLGQATLLANGYLDTTQPTVEAIVNGTVHVNIGDASNANSTPTIDGKVFGCNNLAGTPKGHVYVDVYRTAHTSANTYPNPEPASAAVIPTPAATEFAIQEVYGGGNLAHYTTTVEDASTHVHIHNCDNTIQYVYGGGNAANTMANEVTIDGGRIEYVFGGGNGKGTGNPGANVEGDAKVNLGGGVINYVFGGSNTLGVVNGITSVDFVSSACTRMVKELYGGGNEAPGGTVEMTIPCGASGLNVVFGGSKNADIGSQTLFNGGTKKNITLTIEGGEFAQVFGGNNQGGTIWGDVTLNLKGGTIVDAFGGNNAGGNIKGTITVNVEDAENTTCPLVLTNVFGGGKDAAYTPADATISSPLVNVKHKKSGTSITGSVFGGGQGATAVVTANPVVTIGDSNGSHLTKIDGNVYGGGDAAAVSGNTTVTYNDNNSASQVAKLFGGGNQAGVSGSATVTLTSGKVTDGVYGGCNTSGTINGNVIVNVTGGTAGTSGTTNGAVYGGGLGADTKVKGNVAVTIGGGTINNDVYGGSAMGLVNCNDVGNGATSGSHTDVTLNAGTINGSLYGGGHGISGANAHVWGPVQVTVTGGTVTGGVYGCNNANGAPQSTVNVDIYGTDTPTGTYALANVFGGGNQANYPGTPVVKIHNCNNSIEYVYGGGNAATVQGTDVTVYGGKTIGNVFGGCYGANVTTSGTNVKIYGGTIGKVFGGNNQTGSITGAIQVNIDKQGDTDAHGTATACTMKIDEVYSGGNVAESAPGTITIGCTGTLVTLGAGQHYGIDQEGIRYVYGGANQAKITGNITLTINSGIIENVFGGNNQSGTISGTIQVNINKNDAATCASNWYVGNVFGGGNVAAYSGTPDVNIINGTVSGSVYGGGNLADVGGGDVAMTGGAVLTGIYGGCNTSGDVGGDINVTITGGTIGTDATHLANVFGGGEGYQTTTSGNVTVNFGECATKDTPHSEYPKLYGDIYGGSALGDVNTNANQTTTVNVLNGELINVFGGGLGNASHPAKVNGQVVVNIGAPTSRTLDPENDTNKGKAIISGNVYGCNNTNGSPQDKVTVNIYRTNRTTDQELYGTAFALNDVFGGGNQANYIPLSTSSNKELNLIIHGCYNTIQRVFGGSNAAAAGTSGNTVDVNTNIQGGRIQSVFGGGNGEVSAANINGDVDLQIHGGIVDEFFVGSNQNGTISGNSNVTVDQSSGCENVLITEFFCGGKYANVVGDIEATINCSDVLNVTNLYGGCKEADVVAGNGKPGNVHLSVYGGHYTNVFGGSKGKVGNTAADAADIDGSVTLDLYGGTIENVFGGSNVNGNIKGTITVNILDKEDQDCPLYITNIYGGSNLTSYTPTSAAAISPVVNVVHIKSGVSGNVYGASKGVVGTAATVKANPLVNIGYESSSMSSYIPSGYTVPANPRAIISGSVFGGGDAATVEGNTAIFLRKKAKVFGNVYGGGNMGEVTGNTKVIVNGASE